MKNITTIFTALLLLTLMFTSSVYAADKAEKKAKKKMASYAQVIKLNDAEHEQVYQLLLNEQTLLKAAKKEHKGDKKSFKAAIKPVKAETASEIEAIIGSEKMEVYLASRVKK
ncbi:hypothetical protein [Colwellia piezophila]|uniref:hypothetical protein n=1 Tax=Colwellia piezophila TaxID=211668 RepID=UPI000361596B|nr:hypothetical protein [Colwellia piezophila]